MKEERDYDRSINRTFNLGGGYLAPSFSYDVGWSSTDIRGYSFTLYAGNTAWVEGTDHTLYLGACWIHDKLVYYLYHGTYGSTYGIFYLSSSTNDKYFMSVNGNDSISGIDISLDAMCISELIESTNTSKYFDVMPDSWLSYLRQVILDTYRYTLCFIPQSEVEDFLNTYWRYTPNK